jgi:hypothetical protein
MGERRLRVSGFVPIAMNGAAIDPKIDAVRLAASLLFPVVETKRMAKMVMRMKEE